MKKDDSFYKVKKMKLIKPKTREENFSLIYNHNIRIDNIPKEITLYQVEIF